MGDDEDLEDYDDDNEFDENSMSHSLLKQSQVQQHQQCALVTGHELMVSSKALNGSTTVKTEQNEKMIKKNKVIELYKEHEHGTELVKDIERVLNLQSKEDEFTPSSRSKEYLKQCLNLIKGK